MGKRQRARARRAKLREAKPTTIAGFIALHEADLTYADRTDRVRDEILEALGGESENRWIWIRDITDNWVVYEDEGTGSPNPGCYRVGYTMTVDGDVDLVGPAVPVEAQTIYVPEAPEDSPDVPLVIQPAESAAELVGDLYPLVESVVRRDGTIPIKIIGPGWGTSGFYDSKVIEASGPAAFPAGTQMFWDHPTGTEDVDRPERSLRDLSAVLASDAYWQENGVRGPGLYGDAKVFAEYQPAIEELAPHIGVSIRALGKAHLGEAEGRQGLIIDEIVGSKSVDFVTVAGAGGEVLSLFESARGRRPSPAPVLPKENAVDLQEALASNTKLTTDLTEATALGTLAAAERDAARTELARLSEAAVLREARDVVSAALADEKHQALPQISRPRLVESLSANPPVKDGKLDTETLTTRITEAVTAEIEYAAALSGRGAGTVTGLGGEPITEAQTQVVDALADNLGRLGLSESGAKVAAAGRH